MKSYNTVSEAVESMFFEQVLCCPKKPITKTTHLSDFAPDKKFVKEYIQMYVDKSTRVFGVSIRNIQSKPLVEILKFLSARKLKDGIYGQRKFDVKKFRDSL